MKGTYLLWALVVSVHRLSSRSEQSPCCSGATSNGACSSSGSRWTRFQISWQVSSKPSWGVLLWIQMCLGKGPSGNGPSDVSSEAEKLFLPGSILQPLASTTVFLEEMLCVGSAEPWQPWNLGAGQLEEPCSWKQLLPFQPWDRAVPFSMAESLCWQKQAPVFSIQLPLSSRLLLLCLQVA